MPLPHFPRFENHPLPPIAPKFAPDPQGAPKAKAVSPTLPALLPKTFFAAFATPPNISPMLPKP